MAYRILLVDDEPGIRATMPQVLALHGFEVTCTATVAEALAEIGATRFDVLVSDLNIGQPGDGFTVVSAMRRTQPDCITFILTGYPDFKTALEAIRAQVDDYLTKPASVPDLVSRIEQKVKSRGSRQAQLAGIRIAEVIEDNVNTIVQQTLAQIKASPELNTLSLDDEQLSFPFAPLLRELVALLASPAAGNRGESMRSAAMRGHIQHLQGYTIPMIVSSLRFLQNSVYDVIDENLLRLDISYLIQDLRRMQNNMALQLHETTRAYLDTPARRLLFNNSERWTGWFCGRCCWNWPASAEEQKRMEQRVQAEFDNHNCERYARENWRLMFNSAA